MAPAKKGAGKAAACQKWKLGDLVLAKVKGFPAWPAKISEPELWGQTHDRKKVFVHFFGTQEIGFCAPLDVQMFTLELKNKLLARCQGKAASDFTRAVGEICEEYDNLEGEKQDFAPEIQRSNARECDESSNDSIEKIHYNEDTEMLTSGHETEEMLEVRNDWRAQKHCQTMRENDLNQGIHRQVDSQKKQVAVVAADNKEKSYSLIKFAKKEENTVKEVPVVIKKHSSIPKTNNSKSSLKEENTANHTEGRSKNNQFGAASAMDELDIKQKKGGLKRSLDTESHNYRVDTGVDCHVKQQNQISSSDTNLIPDQPMRDYKFENHLPSIGKELTETRLSPDRNLLELRKSATNKSETEIEYFRYGNTEGNIQVSALKEKMKGKRDVESIQEIIMNSDKNLILSPFIDKRNEEREVIGKLSQQNSILKKKRNPLKKHNSGASVLMKTSVETIQTGENVSVEDENVFEVSAEHRKKRTQLKGRKHKLNMDENLPLVKKARVQSEDESSKVPDCLDIGGSTSAAHNAGRNFTVHNELSHDGHLKSAIFSSSPQIVGSLPQGQECSVLTDRGTCLPPKADKYRLRSNLPGDEAALPPSKRRHRAQEAMSACVAAAANASVYSVTAGSCGRNDAWWNSSEDKPLKGCFENEGMPVHANEGMKLSDMSSPVKETAKVVIKKSLVGTVSLLSHGSLPSEPSYRLEDKQVDIRPHGQRDKRQAVDNVNMNTHAKELGGLPFCFLKMDEAQQNGSFEPLLPSPKKKDGSEPVLRKGISPQLSPMKAHAVKGDPDHHEFTSKSIKVKKSCTTPAKKSGGSSRKDLLQSSSEKLSQGLLHKHAAVRKNEHASPIRSGVEPLVDKVVASSKDSLKINGAVVKTEAISYSTDLHLEKANKIREAYEAGKEVKFKVKSKETDTTMPSTSLKHLIAAAQAKREQTRSANIPNHVANEEIVNSIPTFISSPSPIRESSSHRSSPIQFHSGSLAPEENNNIFTRAESRSPRGNVQQWGQTHVVDMRPSEEHKISSDRKPFGGMLSGDTEAAIARDTFEGMLETLSRTKESIGRASRHAIDCAKYGIAGEVVELLVQRLEIESSSHRKIDLFFLVDSITQCSHSQKGIAGASYIPAVQAALPRLLAAAAPSGSVARENRRQCLKVLRLWLERKILPESILRQYMNDFGYSNDDRSGGNFVRRPRVERAVDDPMREIEGKLDEYGSNATFHLPGFSMANVFEDDEEPFTSDRKNNNESLVVETVEAQVDQTSLNDPIERHCHILEDVDGELEMEDVSPTSDCDADFCKDNIMQPQAQQFPHYLYPPDRTNPCPPLPLGSPPLPEDPPPSPPPLPASPPPPPPSSPPPPPPDSPPFVCQPPLPHSYPVPMNDPQPHLMNGNVQQPSHVVNNATVVDSIAYSSSAFPVSQIHHGQNVTSFNSPRSFEFLQSTVPEVSYSAAHAQQLQLNNPNLSFAQQSYLPPPPTIGLSSQFSYVRAEIQANVRECESQSAQEDQWRLLPNDRCTGSANLLPINQAGSVKSTLCSNMQEVTPGICWPTGGPPYPSGSHLPTQNLTIRAPGGPMSNMDVGYTAYLDQSAGLTGGMVAAPTNQVMIQMLSSRSGYSALNVWRPT